jgi:HK97 family phage prohead protease
MPYFITDQSADCSGWAVIKDDGEVMGCHNSKEGAIDQMVAISLEEGIEPGGERRAAPGTLRIGDYVSWNSSGGRARGEVKEIVEDGVINVPDSSVEVTGTPADPAALIQVYEQVQGGWRDTEVYVGHKFSTLTRIDPLPEPEDEEMDEDEDEYEDEDRETRQVNLAPPAYMRAAARRGLRYYEEGKGGDGLVERTIREARAMAAGNVTADKWVRIRAWISRHLVDLDAPAANPSSPDFPSAGVVAHLLWGSGPSKRGAQRALAYAEGVVARLEEENRALISVEGKEMAKIETRVNVSQFEVRETEQGMTFEGYAAVFNSSSEPLPFTEKIAPGAFHRSLRARNDIKLLWNHDTGSVLGSTRAGTLTLKEDSFGLKVKAELPNTTLGRDVRELIRRGDVDSMSFGFSVPSGGDEWSSDGTERLLRSVRLHEVSIVAFPAYSATAGTASVRGIASIAKRAEVDEDILADALTKVEIGESLSASESEALSKTISALTIQEETVEEEKAEELNSAMLELKKKKLELLLKGI